jgi:hypothetical protein
VLNYRIAGRCIQDDVGILLRRRSGYLGLL